MFLDRCRQLVEQVADRAAVEGAEVAGKPGGGDRLGLGQVVALGLGGQVGLDDVERGEVGTVLIGPVDPDPDQGPGGQVDTGRVLLVAGQDQQGQGRATLDGDLVAVLDGAGHVAGGTAARCPGGVGGHHPALSSRSPYAATCASWPARTSSSAAGNRQL